MKRYKCLGCRFENDSGKMGDNICPYCGEFMEEIDEEFNEIFDKEDIDE